MEKINLTKEQILELDDIFRRASVELVKRQLDRHQEGFEPVDRDEYFYNTVVRMLKEEDIL